MKGITTGLKKEVLSFSSSASVIIFLFCFYVPASIQS